MEGKLGRLLKVLNAPFRGSAVDSHYLTQPSFNDGRVLALRQDPRLDTTQAAKDAVRQIRETDRGTLFQEAMIAGVAYEITPGKDLPTHAKRAKYAESYMLQEFRNKKDQEQTPQPSFTKAPATE